MYQAIQQLQRFDAPVVQGKLPVNHVCLLYYATEVAHNIRVNPEDIPALAAVF
jgi:hypothetical protein